MNTWFLGIIGGSDYLYHMPPRNKAAGTFVAAVVSLCALVNGGQRLFFLYECWMMVIFFFFIAVGRVLRHNRYRGFERRAPPFFGVVQKIINNAYSFPRSKKKNGVLVFPAQYRCMLEIIERQHVSPPCQLRLLERPPLARRFGTRCASRHDYRNDRYRYPDIIS